ncbi:MAG: nuclear transport factor 2 family protein [Bacteroidota bacterium]
MKNFIVILLGLSVALSSCDSSKNATTTNTTTNMKNETAIQAFYNKALTVNPETRPTAVLSPLMAEGYASTNSTGAKNAEQLMGQLEFFWQLIPDLKWEIQDIIQEGDQYVVRSKATGTPNGDFMGIPTDGSKAFSIMTIDIHQMKDGQFLNTHHVEDWATAFQQLKPEPAPDASKATMDIALAFMDAMGKGDMDNMIALMHDDMVWANSGDKTLPWIGPWQGKKAILEQFMPVFGANFQTVKWEPNDGLSSDDTAAFFGRMIGKLTKSDAQTSEFDYALRVKVKDGKVILWNWFEDSYEVSKVYHQQ